MLISAENCDEFLAKIAVAPYVGAWIETHFTAAYRTQNESLPTWERGLKPDDGKITYEELKSLPTWERGLKQDLIYDECVPEAVAPYVGAWIETREPLEEKEVMSGRSLRGSVD